MPLNGSGVASKPSGTTASPNTTIESAKFNSVIDDVYEIFNTARPVSKGGTGGTSATEARFNLGVEADVVDIASATTTAIGGASSINVRVTGSNTITGFGTIAAGTFRRVRFAASLTLTHNATSLILPGASNITTAAGDVGEFISEGSGNWRCVSYTKANGAGVYERAWELIRTNVAVTASAWTFADLGIYRAIRISGRVKPGNDNVTLRMNVSTNNGVSYDSNVANYSNVYSTVSGTTAAHGTDTTSGTWFITPTGVGNASGRFASFELIIHEFNQAAWSSFEGRGTLFGSDGVHKRFEMAGAHVTSVALNAIQIVFSSGTFDGTITLEGIRG